MSDWRSCRGCGARIRFITGPAGRPIPVQQVRTIYDENGPKTPEGTTLRKLEQSVPGPYFVSHFETCSKASEFSRGRR